MNVGEALTKLDDFLLDRAFQPVTDRLMGKPSAFDVGMSLEMGAVVLEMAADCVLFAAGWLTWNAALWDGFSCACGIWLYVFMGRQRHLVRPGVYNPLRFMYRSLRLLALMFAVWSAVDAAMQTGRGALAYALSALSNIAFVAGMYFVSCQPRPPGWQASRKRRAVVGMGLPQEG